jgi:SPP1 family phage portal protein
MTAEQLQNLIADNMALVAKYKSQKAYAIGNNPGILRPYPKPDPDNRKPIPLARQAVTFVQGYMGKPGNIKYSGDYYDSTLKDIYNFNDEELITAGELEDALIHGQCFELHWLDEDGNRNFYPVPADQSIPIYDTGLKRKLIGFVWYRTVDDVQIASVYDETTVQTWEAVKDKWIMRDEAPHGYGQVPVNIGFIDRDGRNLFDHIIPLQDMMDKLLSADVANEADRYSAALLAMAERIDSESKDDAGRTMVDRIKELRILDGLGDGDVRQKVAFITKDLPVDFIKFALEFTERMARESLQIPNMMDPKFGESSGIAKAFQLLPLEYLCSRIEAYFTRFLQNRIYLVAGISRAIGDNSDGAYDVQVSFKRNLPYDLVEISDVVSKLKGILSDETLLKLFPSQIIPDVEEELEKIGSGAVPELEDSPVDGL